MTNSLERTIEMDLEDTKRDLFISLVANPDQTAAQKLNAFYIGLNAFTQKSFSAPDAARNAIAPDLKVAVKDARESYRALINGKFPVALQAIQTSGEAFVRAANTADSYTRPESYSFSTYANLKYAPVALLDSLKEVQVGEIDKTLILGPQGMIANYNKFVDSMKQ